MEKIILREMKRKQHAINKEISLEILTNLPSKKKEVLVKALDRNFILTSSYVLEGGILAIYKEGFYLILDGTRVGFSVFAYDNDGDLIIADRKPNDSKLHHLYDDCLNFDESDFFKLIFE